LLGLPIGVWLTFKVGFGLQGLWIGLTIALIYCAAVGSYLCWKTDWDWEVKKVLERLKEEDRVKQSAEDEEARLTN
jgi:MATE family multidrug resistance protein